MPTPWSRRLPWPYHVRINGYGVMTKGPLPAVQVKPLSAATPTSYDYSSSDPFKERVFPFARLTGGMGERYQSSNVSKRYYAAVNVDMSIGGVARKGALFHLEQIATASGQAVNQVLPAEHGGATTDFALVGRYVYRREGSSWALSKDLAATALQAVVFQGTEGTSGLWVSTDSGALWKYDGTTLPGTWTQADLPAGQNAVWVERLRDELWIFGGADARSCTGDPLLIDSWGGAIQHGSPDKSATYLRAVSDQVFFFKEDGIFGVNTNGTSTELFPELRHVSGPWRGRNAHPWRDALWFAYGSTFYRMTGGETATLDPIGPERLVENDSEVQGSPLAFTNDDFFGYLLLVNDDSTYLLKFGTWLNPEAQGAATYQFSDVWNGAVKKWAKVGATIAVSREHDNPWLVVGFDDGTVEYCLLPVNSPDPVSDPNCQFNTDEGWVEAPLHTLMAEAVNKHWRAFEAFGPRVTFSDAVGVTFRTNTDAEWTDLGEDFTAPGVRRNLPSSVVSRYLNFRAYLKNGGPDSTPILEGLGLAEQIVPDFLLEFNPTIAAATGVPRRDGVADRRTGEEIRAQLQALVGVGPATFVLPDETSQDLTVVDYEEAMAPVGSSYGPAWDVAIKAITWRSLQVFGIWDRTHPYTWDELKANYRWSQLPRL